MPNYNLGSVEGEIRIGYNSQGPTQARADIEQLIRTATGQELLLRVGGDIGRLRSTLDIARQELARLEALAPSVEIDAQIQRARANIDTLEGEIRRIQDVEIDVDANTQPAESAFDGLKARAVVAGAAAGTVLSSALGNAIAQQDATANLQAQMGLTPEYAAKYGKIAGDLYANNFGSSMEETNQAIMSLQNNIGDLGDFSTAEITKMGQSALGLASTFNIDVNEATRAAGQLMKTGLAPDAQTAFDIIADGFQGGANASDDFIDTINEYSIQFQKFGLNGQEMTTLLQQGLQGGARDADLVADAFKELGIRVIDGSKSTAEGFAAIGMNADQMATRFGAGGETARVALDETVSALQGMEDPVARNAAGVALFGTQWEDMGNSIMALDLGQARASMQGVAGTMDQVNATMGETAAAKIETTRRGFETFTMSLVAMDGPMGAVVAGAAAMGPEMLTMGAAVITAGATAGPALLGMITTVGSYVISMAGAVISTVAGWAVMAATSVASAAVVAAAWLAANPIVLIIAALAAIIAVVIYYWDEIVGFLSGVWETIKAMVIEGWNTVFGWFQQRGAALVAMWMGIWNSIWNFLTGLWQRITSTITNAIEAIREAILNRLEAIRNNWLTIWNGIREFVIGLIAWLINFFREGITNLGNNVRNGINNVVQFFRDLPGNIVRAVGNLGSLLMNAGRDVVMGIWNGIVSMGNWLYDNVWGWIRSMIPGPVQQALGIASPSKFMRDEVGKQIPAGIMVGMEAESDGLIAQAKAMTADLSTAATMGLDMPALTMAATGTVSGVGVPALAAASGAIGNTSNSLQIGSVTLNVTGNLDPTNPVQWRAAIESIQEELVNVEASYR
jgi:phage-related minor tail protein